MTLLSAHAIAELDNIAREPVPTCAINPGVKAKLFREGLAELVDLPSPFPTHRGANIGHLKITDAGRKVLEAAITTPMQCGCGRDPQP